jgi:hypothetical protein
VKPQHEKYYQGLSLAYQDWTVSADEVRYRREQEGTCVDACIITAWL